MGKFKALHKYFAVFLALVACYETLLTQGRQIKPLNQHSLLSSEKKKVDSSMIPKLGVASFGDSVADVNAFRPTTPGNSPGVGHRKFAAQDKVMKAIVSTVQSPDVKVYVTEGSENDFRPTDPGHSPGVGHSQQNKIGHLN
ncbi:hypothetical protein VNO77_25313 [Canavalia gladiata]|uniref:Uncharacterized protein n=1 Tax=Canavalia gladiata TaxID=3824 RepID=A0AAN9QDG8_CANGL